MSRFPWLRTHSTQKSQYLWWGQDFANIFSHIVNKVGKNNVWHQQVFLSIVKLGPFTLMLILNLFFIFQGKSAGQSSPVCQDVRNFRISLTLPMTCNFWDFFMTDQTRRYYHSSSFFQIQTFWILFWKKPNGRQTHKITRNIKEKTKKIRLLFTDKVLNSFIFKQKFPWRNSFDQAGFTKVQNLTKKAATNF